MILLGKRNLKRDIKITTHQNIGITDFIIDTFQDFLTA